jgi:hypothetical protein
VAEHHFLTRWHVRGTLEEVSDVLENPLDLPRWWPSVYLAVTELAPGDPVTHVGRVIDLYTKGWLPYTLRWKFTVTEARAPHGFTLVAEGDFVGTGVWTLEKDADFATVYYDWRIAVTKPLLRIGTPVFARSSAPTTAGRWPAARRSLVLELQRRRATTDTERQAVAAPPRPTFARKNQAIGHPAP